MPGRDTLPPLPIEPSSMFDPLLRADPSFEPNWLAFQNAWIGGAKPPLYVALGDLARHLIGCLATGRTERFNDVFDVVELWQTEGTPWVREAAIVGLLEDLQNENLHTLTQPSDFEIWLRPKSKSSWDKVALFWSEGKLADD